MSDSDESGYEGGELDVDFYEMTNLLDMVFNFFVNKSQLISYAALYEAMMDGFGYVYYCRRQWRKSSLLMSIEPDLATRVRSYKAGIAVEQFLSAAEEPLHGVVDHYVKQHLGLL